MFFAVGAKILYLLYHVTVLQNQLISNSEWHAPYVHVSMLTLYEQGSH